ncbi:hypothetical protein Ahy_A07g031206 [Arachis hypogaea]|uniref:Uncharacterized protein n=1 Tax=Arachis hypogaea TaxID=3818 RepID=A0A445C363_ARAHY|nr:hypothetical protein Ahy_A07g031206 [Arachis hypogaea]
MVRDRKGNLTGSISSMLSNIQHLAHLDLSNNKFSSSIPSFPSNIQYLIHLDLSFNGFNGSIRSLLLSNLKHLTHLDLSNNEFSGSIPSLLSNLQSLTHLDLSFNQFSGSIPSSLSNLQHLTHLDLSDNTFSGQIPNLKTEKLIAIQRDEKLNKEKGKVAATATTLKVVMALHYNKQELNHNIIPSIHPSKYVLVTKSSNIRGYADIYIKFAIQSY